jgi:hypothetical protein
MDRTSDFLNHTGARFEMAVAEQPLNVKITNLWRATKLAYLALVI